MNRRADVTVSTELELRLVVSPDASLPVPAGLAYDVADPYAVHATFHTGEDESVDWVFARELLATGLQRSIGDGDVRVWPSAGEQGEIVCVGLTSPEGSAVLEAASAQIEDFLHRTEQLVPSGTESRHIDLDGALAALLAADESL